MGASRRAGTGPQRAVLPARRGALYDRNGVPLAITQEFYHVGVAPNELTDRAVAVRLLIAPARRSAAALDREFRARKRWIYLHGPFTATQVQPLRAGQRHSPEPAISSDSTRRATLARPDHRRLSASAGSAPRASSCRWTRFSPARRAKPCFLKDRAGRRYDSPARLIREPVAGQRRGAHARRRASGDRGAGPGRGASPQMEAEGGDVVFLDPDYRRAARPGFAAAGRDRRSARLRLHRSLRAGLDGQAVHRGRPAAAPPGGQHRHGVRARAAPGSCR